MRVDVTSGTVNKVVRLPDSPVSTNKKLETFEPKELVSEDVDGYGNEVVVLDAVSVGVVTVIPKFELGKLVGAIAKTV